MNNKRNIFSGSADDSGYVGSPSSSSSSSASVIQQQQLSSGGNKEMELIKKSHKLTSNKEEGLYYSSPSLCHFCTTFIQSTREDGEKGVRCEDCLKSFHSSCLNSYNNKKNNKISDYSRLKSNSSSGEYYKGPDIESIENCCCISYNSSFSSSTPFFGGGSGSGGIVASSSSSSSVEIMSGGGSTDFLPPQQWSPKTVKEWLLSNGYADFVINFLTEERSDLNGEVLKEIASGRRSLLGEWLGLPGEEKQQEKLLNLLTASIIDLFNGEDKYEKLKEPGSINNHNLIINTFNQVTNCDVCGRCLNGLFLQGYFCGDCLLITHKKCAAINNLIPPCSSSEKNKRIDCRSYLIRCRATPLTSQFSSSQQNNLKILLNNIENRINISNFINSHQIHFSSDNNIEEIEEKEEEKDVDNFLNTFDLFKITNAVRSWLGCLPDPLLPPPLYNELINISKISIDSDARPLIEKLINSSNLNSHNNLTLSYLFTSFIRIINKIEMEGRNTGNSVKDCEGIIGRFYGGVLLRGISDELGVWTAYENAPIHSRIIQLIIQIYSINSKMEQQISCSKINKIDINKELEKMEWFWESCSRDEALEKLYDSPDGSFLVRPASTKNQNEFTLTVRYQQTAKLLRISYKNNKYGLVEPFSFNSVIELINYYSINSLSEYNNNLDVKLLFPVSKFERFDGSSIIDEDGGGGGGGGGGDGKLLAILDDVSRDFLVKSRYLELHSVQYNKTLGEIHLKKQALDAFNSALQFFTDQIQIHKQLQNNDDGKESKTLENNFNYLKSRIEDMNASREQLASSLKLQTAYARLVENEINTVKPQLVGLRKQRSRVVKRLESLHTPQSKIEQSLSPLTVDIWSEKGWYRPEASRQEAQSILKDKPEGTFLVRKSSKGGELALSLHLGGGVVGHCIIYECPVGYGFTRPTTYFPKINALILFYSAHSLADFNPQLKTCLTFPAFI